MFDATNKCQCCAEANQSLNTPHGGSFCVRLGGSPPSHTLPSLSPPPPPHPYTLLQTHRLSFSVSCILLLFLDSLSLFSCILLNSRPTLSRHHVITVASRSTTCFIQYCLLLTEKGRDTTPGDWQLLETSFISTVGSGPLGLNLNLEYFIPNEERYGIYVTFTSGVTLLYTSSLNESGDMANDGVISLVGGRSLTYPFSSPTGNRDWRGIVCYDTLATPGLWSGSAVVF